MNKTTIFIVFLILLLAAGNVYQWQNPNVVEVPADGQQEIDKGAWVQRSAYITRGMLLDSLKVQNEALAAQVRESRDEIANLTLINGRLNLKVDSLSATGTRIINLPPITGLHPQETETVYTAPFSAEFGNGLFRVNSLVQVSRIKPFPDKELSLQIDNTLELQQLRDIRLSVTNTMNKDRSRLLTYVTSPDFDHLEYQTFTEIEHRKRWPWFWIGVGTGAAGILIIQ